MSQIWPVEEIDVDFWTYALMEAIEIKSLRIKESISLKPVYHQLHDLNGQLIKAVTNGQHRLFGFAWKFGVIRRKNTYKIFAPFWIGSYLNMILRKIKSIVNRFDDWIICHGQNIDK